MKNINLKNLRKEKKYSNKKNQGSSLIEKKPIED